MKRRRVRGRLEGTTGFDMDFYLRGTARGHKTKLKSETRNPNPEWSNSVLIVDVIITVVGYQFVKRETLGLERKACSNPRYYVRVSDFGFRLRERLRYPRCSLQISDFRCACGAASFSDPFVGCRPDSAAGPIRLSVAPNRASCGPVQWFWAGLWERE